MYWPPLWLRRWVVVARRRRGWNRIVRGEVRRVRRIGVRLEGGSLISGRGRRRRRRRCGTNRGGRSHVMHRRHDVVHRVDRRRRYRDVRGRERRRVIRIRVGRREIRRVRGEVRRRDVDRRLRRVRGDVCGWAAVRCHRRLDLGRFSRRHCNTFGDTF